MNESLRSGLRWELNVCHQRQKPIGFHQDSTQSDKSAQEQQNYHNKPLRNCWHKKQNNNVSTNRVQ